MEELFCNLINLFFDQRMTIKNAAPNRAAKRIAEPTRWAVQQKNFILHLGSLRIQAASPQSKSACRPSKFSSRENVEMQMMYGLTCTVAAVRYYAEAVGHAHFL